MSALSYTEGVCITLRADRTNWFADRPVGLTVDEGQV